MKKNFTRFGNLHMRIWAMYSLFLCNVFILNQLNAQLIDDGNTHTVAYNGSYQDFTVPNNPAITKITFNLTGGDGGYAQVNDSYPDITCFCETPVHVKSNGGAGASATITFQVGAGVGQLPHGSIIRFVIGRAGVSGSSNGAVGVGFDYGGGGGGTGILYKGPSDANFTILGVAGGGSGAYQGMIAYSSVDSEDGQGGRSGTSGGNGNGDLGAGAGGSNGNGGGGNPGLGAFGGGGGGAFSNGGGIDCISFQGSTVNGEGGAGGQDGGYGGNSEGCLSFTWRNGGFGFGGGGAGSGTGGGGGGYSGGGVGGTTGRGGGGGSYANPIAESENITAGGSTGSPGNGFASYRVTLNNPPIVVCQNATIYLNSSGLASVTPQMITFSASDPEGGLLTYSISQSSFNCNNVGDNLVTLTVTDNVGLTATCSATVKVIDDIKPTVITQNATIQLNALGQASITTAMINNGSTDNCGIQSYALDKMNFNCSNVGLNTVILTVTDVNGNTASKTATVLVEDNIAPIISSTTPTPAVLWPPNHKMVPVSINIQSIDNCAGSGCKIISVSSNEPLNSTGDGNTAFDWEIINNFTVNLRAERSGNLEGRIYTITMECTDASGNKTRSTTTVSVPHNGPVKSGREAAEISEKSNKLTMSILNNPTDNNTPFTLIIESENSSDPIQLRLYDAAGKINDEKNNIIVGQKVEIGKKTISGLYFIEAMQNGNVKIAKLMKR